MKFNIIENLKSTIIRYPKLYLLIKATYFKRKILKGIRINNFAKGRSVFESFEDLGVGAGLLEVELYYSALNYGTERANLLGLENTKLSFPNFPGGAGVGRVIRVGSGVIGFKSGDMVTGPAIHATNTLIDSKQAIKVPANVPLELAAFVHLGVISMQSIRMGNVSPSDRILVIGQGIIGRLATLFIRCYGCDVRVLTKSSLKLRHFNEKSGFYLDDSECLGKLAEFTPTLIIDVSGSPDSLQLAVNLVSEGGRVVLLGSNRGFTKNFSLPKGKKLTLTGAHIKNIGYFKGNSANNYLEDANQIVSWFKDGTIELSDLKPRIVKSKGIIDYYNSGIKNGDDCAVLFDWRDRSDIEAEIKSLDLKIDNFKFNFTEKLNIAVIGCGDSGIVHSKAIKESSGFIPYIVMDTNFFLARKLGNLIGSKFSSDFLVVLDDEQVNTVLITTPHHLHYQLAKLAIEAGKNVIVDKPLVLDINQANELINLAKDKGVLVSTFHQRIYESTQQLAKKLFDYNVTGEVIGVSMEYQRDKPMSYWFNPGDFNLNWRAIKTKSGGGFLIMNLMHEIDYFRFITGSEFKSVKGYIETLHHPVEVEDSVAVVFKLDNGGIGTMSGSSVTKGNGGQTMRIWGENGQIVINYNSIDFYSYLNVEKYPKEKWHTIAFKDWADTRRIYFDVFRNKLNANEKTVSDDRGVASLKVVQAIYESATQNKEVIID
jgi:predicted dehydrogenase/threonine dehydrogenase-like Zn-dependent dehydrogenase